ncbi:MAG: T9SS type A sorting domain-containing protein [Candidatus Latescibacterota bacterium]|nr:MAG: T9SS type A sorting domain-containing protein [Candidatus Latescibacterota bacterium]
MNCSKYIVLALVFVCMDVPVWAGETDSRTSHEMLAELLGSLDKSKISTGILYDRVVPLSRIRDYDGGRTSPPATVKHWKQMYFEIWRACVETPSWPELGVIVHKTAGYVGQGIVPVAFMDFDYNRIRPDALRNGALITRGDRLIEGEGDPYTRERVFAVTALKEYTHRGKGVEFVFDEAWYSTNNDVLPGILEIDFDDGSGCRAVRFGDRCHVSYHRPGRKTIRVKATFPDGTNQHGSFYFRVERLQTPDPHDTLSVTATIPYNAEYGTGEAYVYLSDTHGSITNPVIVVEGFDLDNTMNWDELYHLLNEENLLETLRGKGFDAIVLNFTDATDYVQKNSFVVTELIQLVHTYLDSYRDIALVGASMGGLCSRYALAYLETHGVDHRVRTFISFDAPQSGANIPLGVQYWLDFFSEMSEDAAFLLSRLDTPAARQMLAYHHTDPPGSTGESDPLRAGLIADFTSIGEYPINVRKTAIANGSGSQTDQGFAAGDQIIDYEYNSLFVDITGNVWAVPDGASHIIFDGLIDIIFVPREEMSVTVSGTLPYDNAPGGSRASMAQMDSTEAPYGDIVAIHPSHCFIPTVSALDLETGDLFYDIAGDPNLLSITPFDVVYYPLENQEHVSITAENAAWFLSEIEVGVTSVASDRLAPSAHPVLYQNVPNPFNPETTIRFALPRRTSVRLDVYDARGKLVVTLIDGTMNAGTKSVVWNGKDGEGREVGSGVYFCRLKTETGMRAKKMVLLR